MTDREFAFNFLPTILVLENGKIKNNIGFLAKKRYRGSAGGAEGTV